MLLASFRTAFCLDPPSEFPKTIQNPSKWCEKSLDVQLERPPSCDSAASRAAWASPSPAVSAAAVPAKPSTSKCCPSWPRSATSAAEARPRACSAPRCHVREPPPTSARPVLHHNYHNKGLGMPGKAIGGGAKRLSCRSRPPPSSRNPPGNQNTFQIPIRVASKHLKTMHKSQERHLAALKPLPPHHPPAL